MKIVADNRKARHDYHILERIEAGIVLTGTEVKSCRAHQVSLAEAYVRPREDELWLVGAHIAPYEQGNRNNHEPKRDRKLLLHRKEIRRLAQAVEARGLTLVPLRVYFNARSKVKLEIGLCRGKQAHDKRADLRRREDDMEARRIARSLG